MSRQVLFVQGAGKAVHDAWDDKLVESLKHELGKGYEILYPRMPDEASPRYTAWKTALLQTLDKLKDGAIIVGHSIGGAFLIHALAERPPKPSLRALSLLAAPFIGNGGWHSDEIESRTDFARRLPADLSVFLYHGTADEMVPFKHLELYARWMPQAVSHPLSGRDHQLNNDLGMVARDILSLG